MKFIACIALVLALLAALAGVVVPVQFGSVSETTLAAAGRAEGNVSLRQRAEELFALGKTGPAELLLRAEAESLRLQGIEPELSPLMDEIAAYRAEHPMLTYAGGPDVFFDQFLKLIRLPEEERGSVSVNALLIPAGNRAELLDYLKQSSNATVLKLLETRRLTSVTRFMPVSAPAGAPLDSAILTSALLVQGNYLQESLTREIRGLAVRALELDHRATDQLEAFYLSVLGSGQRLNWIALAEWVRPVQSWPELVSLTTFLRQNPEQLSLLYAAVVLSGEPQAVTAYLRADNTTPWQDLALGLSHGKLALDALLESGRPVSRTPFWLKPLVEQVPPEFADWAFRAPALALGLKLALFFLAGLFLAMSLKRFLAGESVRETRRRGPLAVMTDVGLGGVLVVILVLATEPNLLAQTVSEPGKLFLEFEITQPSDIVNQETMDTSGLDQITLLVLLIFFVVQLVIYSVCLLKLAQIRNAPVPADTKLKLLENEDNLFDAGLYVGLSGTVISLLMLAMGIVQASLVSAYASTLFGIIFVALLKILNVRPMRRKLILETN